ncbi:MAG: DUF4347 domain-containing protein, partial [Planctomycetaceae bacterium]|nr:DUF4347 domain-containing protein [Planctomycetaceae bacterium]
GSGIQPGNSYLDADATLGYAGDLAGDLASWADAFKREADLLIYGCELASTTDGRSLVDVLSEWHAPAESARPRQQWAPSKVGALNSATASSFGVLTPPTGKPNRATPAIESTAWPNQKLSQIGETRTRICRPRRSSQATSSNYFQHPADLVSRLRPHSASAMNPPGTFADESALAPSIEIRSNFCRHQPVDCKSPVSSLAENRCKNIAARPR